MSKPNQKKLILYGLLLGGAVIGLLIDRLSSSEEPASPRAAITTLGVSATAIPTSHTDVKGPAIARIFTLVSSQSSAESQPAETESTRDAFSLTPRMQKYYADTSPTHKAEQARQAENNEETRRQECERFQSAHKLKGTSIRKDAAWALIDDTIVRAGEQIDGFTLSQIERYRVELIKDDLTVTLTLPMP